MQALAGERPARPARKRVASAARQPGLHGVPAYLHRVRCAFVGFQSSKNRETFFASQENS